jgi:hypothetical protein
LNNKNPTEKGGAFFKFKNEFQMIKLNYPFLAFKAILILNSSLIALSPIFFNKAAGETETEL